MNKKSLNLTRADLDNILDSSQAQEEVFLKGDLVVHKSQRRILKFDRYEGDNAVVLDKNSEGITELSFPQSEVCLFDSVKQKTQEKAQANAFSYLARNN